MKNMFETIVVAINGTDASMNAFKYALGLQRAFGSKVLACYVIDTATIRQLTTSRIFISEESQEYERNLENSGQRYLNFCLDLARQKHLTVQTTIRRGSITGEIGKYCLEVKADVVVLGDNPQEALYRDVIADANREVIRNSRCPVLFIKPPMGDEIYRSL